MNLSEALEFLDEVPYDQFKKELDAADVLLVIKYVEEQYEMQIPGKLFEYLGAGKPILGIMRGSTEAAEILKRSRVGIVPEYGNPESLGRSILELWSQRGRLHEIYRADADYVARFSSESMAQRVHELLSGVVAHGGLAGETRPTPSLFGRLTPETNVASNGDHSKCRRHTRIRWLAGNLSIGSAAKYEDMAARLGFYLIALIATVFSLGRSSAIRHRRTGAWDRGVTTLFAIGLILLSLFTFKFPAAIGSRPRVLFFAAFLFLGMFAGILQSESLCETLVGGINRGGYWFLMVAVMSLHLSKEKEPLVHRDLRACRRPQCRSCP